MNIFYKNVGMTVMAKVITTSEICENAKMARDMALIGKSAFLFVYDDRILSIYCNF